MIGMSMTSLSLSIALVVAVLHATPIALQFNSISFSQFYVLKEIISFFAFCVNEILISEVCKNCFSFFFYIKN